MLIGHLPAGYLLTRAWLGRLTLPPRQTRLLMACGLMGAVFPDIDMLWFYLVDARQHHHHTYWTHLPLFWLLVLTPCALVARWAGHRLALLAVGVFAGNLLLHLLLDSIVGDIWWLAPWIDRPYALFTVPRVYAWWWGNFLLHWSFAIELVVILFALRCWRTRPRRQE